jgi:hypothetical protein
MIADHLEGRPALLPALAATTWLQALVALALFAPGAVAPTANLDVSRLSIFSTAVFAVDVLTSFWAGGLIIHIGSLRYRTRSVPRPFPCRHPIRDVFVGPGAQE